MPKSRRRPVANDRRFRHHGDPSDYGTPERWQHSGRTLELTEKAGVLAARATEEHLIDILFLRGLIEPCGRVAALRFKLDYQRAGLAAHLTGRYAPVTSTGNNFAHIPDRTEAEEAAYRHWRNAVRALGLLASDAVISAVCHDLWPTPTALPRLQDGLKSLAVWYGLDKEKPARGSGKNIEQAAARR